MEIAVLVLAGFVASVLNALAGGGAFVTMPALLLAGLDAREANMTSIVALFPGQVAIAAMARRAAENAFGPSLRRFLTVSLLGGLVGAFLLIATPSSLFAGIVPWLIAFATLVYAAEPWIAPRVQAREAASASWLVAGGVLAIGIYGGYFGGGVGFIAIALLTLAGAAPRAAGATKNVLAAAFNAAAVLAYCLSGELDPSKAVALASGGLAGGFAGGHLALRLPEALLRHVVIALGAVLTVWLLVRGGGANRP
jgi:uncharacterized membrane protein YfcA